MISRLLGPWFDRRDEARARRLRVELGRCRWLVSWSRLDGGWWMARLSCPEVPPTIERIGSSRCRAIGRARTALGRLVVADDGAAARPDLSGNKEIDRWV
jgi:hypothetical protein